MLSLAVVSASASATGAPAPAVSKLFSFSDSRIAESSGLAANSNDSAVFTHNDSGDSARFFKVDTRGNTVAVYTLRGATNVDWEDMATSTDAAGHRMLYFGDIGDNTGSRNEIDVYRVAEPAGASADVPWLRYRFAYPDGAHDAEALLVEPHTHRIYVATKALLRSGELYAAPVIPSASTLNILTPVRSVPALTTSADFSPDGSHIVLLTYLAAYWTEGIDGALHEFSVPLQRQNEAIAFSADGSALLVGSEGVHSSVFRVSLPWASDARASGPPATSSAPGSPPAQSGSPAPSGSRSGRGGVHSSPSPVVLIAVAVAGLLVVLLVVGIARKRRRS